MDNRIERINNLIRNSIERHKQDSVYMVNDSYEILPCKIIKMFDEGEFICEVEIPEIFHKIFMSKTAKLSWNDTRKHLHDKNLYHYMVGTMPYLFGRNLDNGKRLRRELIDLKIKEKQIELEDLIKLKYQL